MAPNDHVRAQVQVASSDVALRRGRDLRWDSGWVATDRPILDYGGPRLQARERVRWHVRLMSHDQQVGPWSPSGTWEMGLLAPSDWRADWISYPETEAGWTPDELRLPRPAPVFSRRFSGPPSVRRARLYITSFGLYEAKLNGVRVGDRYLAPGWTDYERRVAYQSYDVGALIEPGSNLLEVTLGDGWYAGHVSEFGRCQYGVEPELLCQLEILPKTGRPIVIATTKEWTVRRGVIVSNDLIKGERHDLTERAEAPDLPVEVHVRPGVEVVASRDDGVRLVSARKAERLDGVDPGRALFDVGQNIAGIVSLEVTGRPGQRVVVRHGEMLDGDGRLYTANLVGAEQRDEYVLGAEGRVTLEPRFTYHGFRYVEVSGFDRVIACHALELSSAGTEIGQFECSDPIATKLQRNIQASLRANFVGIPTDCPSRDERMAWTGDIAAFAPTALWNADVIATFEDWLVELAGAQLPSGAYPDIAPRIGYRGWGNAGWADCGVLLPWDMYRYTGDPRVLARQYDSMRSYARFLSGDHTDGVRSGGWYGDWLCLGTPTPSELIGTAYLARTMSTFARIADLLGHDADRASAEATARRAKRSFATRFIAPDGEVLGGTQTGYAIALEFGLVPRRTQGAVRGRLIESVRAADRRVTTGFLGMPVLLPALSEAGAHDIAVAVVRETSYPSWGFQIEHGATTTWERWDSWRPDVGFADPGMNSFNHFAFGSVGDWLFRYVGGLSPGDVGFRRTSIRPRTGHGISWARASHESAFGVHEVEWHELESETEVRVTVPPGTEAELTLASARDRIRIDGRPIESSDDVVITRAGARATVMTLPPGRHAIRSMDGKRSETSR